MKLWAFSRPHLKSCTRGNKMKFTENTEKGRRYGKTLVGAHFINNKDDEGSGTETFKALNASDQNDIVGIFPIATEKDVARASEAARKAFESWSQTPAPVRGEVV